MTSVMGNGNHPQTCCVEITEVNANSNFPVLLENRDNVGNLVWVLLLSNEAAFDEFIDFGLDCLYDVRSKPSSLLLNRLGIRFDVEMIHGHQRIEATHVFIAPCKDIYVLPYERYEAFILCWR